jgi:hypothetical protein
MSRRGIQLSALEASRINGRLEIACARGRRLTDILRRIIRHPKGDGHAPVEVTGRAIRLEHQAGLKIGDGGGAAPRPAAAPSYRGSHRLNLIHIVMMMKATLA